jgi:arylsulfatase A-like enzyme
MKVFSTLGQKHPQVSAVIKAGCCRVKSIEQTPPTPTPVDPMPDNNVLLIVCDQLVSYALLPDRVLKLLPGYQAFKKRGIEFTNNYNNRSTCSASRAVIITGVVNTQIQDSMNSAYQSNIVPNIDLNADTLARPFKSNGYKTRYIGKSHLDSRIYHNKPPNFSTNTIGCMRSYGYDTFDKWGDFDSNSKGLLQDCMALQFINSSSQEEYDYYDVLSNTKQSGTIPYLRACKETNTRFLCHVNFVNPHDTQECRSNLAQTEIQDESSQFFWPFCQEQSDELNIKSPFFFDENFTDAYVKNSTLVHNFFEDNYLDYKTLTDLLQNVSSYMYDYQTEPLVNSAIPYNIAFISYYNVFSTTPVNSTDIKSWKNFLNNYYCLVCEADSHIYKIYQELEKLNLLEKTNVIITSDHGDMMGAHGLRCKGYTFNENINVPLLVCSSNLDPSTYNTKSDYLCSSIDLIPTLINVSNITYTSSQFTGESVLQKNTNGKLVPKTKNEYPDKSVVAYVGGNDQFNLYFYYTSWVETTGNTENAPENIFEYAYFHTSVQVYLQGKHFKYGKYVSLKNWLLYTIEVYKIDNFTMEQLIKNANNSDNVALALKDLEDNVSYTFTEIYEQVIKEDKRDVPSILSLETVMAIIKIVDDYTKRYYYIPGCYDDFYKNKKNYYLFCYNMTDDRSEVRNLLDSKNYDPQYNEIFEKLNTILNNSTQTNNMNPIFYISPYQVLVDLIDSTQQGIRDKIINEITGKIENYNLWLEIIKNMRLKRDAKMYILNNN